MSKRKNSSGGEPSKKQKVVPETPTPENVSPITKLSKQPQKLNIPWPDADIITLLTKIEENIPQDDTVSYSTRLETLHWENISFKGYSAAECKETWGALSKQVRKFRLLGEIVTDVKEWVAKPKSSTLKHPLKPKQPNNSYMFFTTEKRQEVSEKHPELNSVDVARKLGQMFKELSDEEREKYVEKAKVAKQEYLEKMQTFYEEHPEMIPKERDRKKKKKPMVQLEPGRGPPEKPKTPFELFFKVESEKESGDCSTHKYRERWNELTEKEKYFWIKWAEEQYEKYLQDLKEYIKKFPNYEPEKLKPIITKKEKQIKNRCSGKPNKPPHSAYQLCVKLILERKEIENLDKKDLMNYISEKWKSMPDDEKNEYKTRIEQMWEEYEIQLEEYLKTIPPEERDEVREKESRNKRSNRSEGKRTSKKVKEPKDSNKGKVEKPKKPPSTPYKYFVSVYKGKENQSEVWDAMTKKEKKVFEDKLKEERNKYLGLFEQYLKSLSKEELEKLGASLGEASSTESEDESRDSDDD